ncbi:MAG: hypothetical protein LBD59_04680 [Prevotellaceae bacterium]|jgi:hypothetical protein|nr:hypothetical protein [Prevotellaceae bacterium]
MKFVFVIALFISVLTIQCDDMEILSSDYMAFENVRYVKNFPEIFSLDNAIEVDLETTRDIIGIKSFRIYDSLMICSTIDKTGDWIVLSLPEYNVSGKYFFRGAGPYEFIQTPSVEHKFFRKEGELYTYVYESQKGKVFTINLDKSIKNNKLDIHTYSESVPPFLFDFAVIDSVTFFCKEINKTETKQIRYLLKNGDRITPPHFEFLNRAAIKENEDFNIISTGARYNREKNMIIEMPVGLNYINMYSVDGSFARTICINNKMDNISAILNRTREDRLYTFADLQIFPNFWGVVYINEAQGIYWTERKIFSKIMLFKWDGEPLAELKLNDFITSFDIDFKTGYLYTLDIQSDKLYKYSIQNILKKIEY